MQTIPLSSENQPDPLLTVKDLVRVLQISSDEVYSLLAGGQLASIRIGRLYRVTRRQLEAFIASRTQGTA